MNACAVCGTPISGRAQTCGARCRKALERARQLEAKCDTYAQSVLIPVSHFAPVLEQPDASTGQNVSAAAPSPQSSTYRVLANLDGTSHHAFLEGWGLPYFHSKTGAPCLLILCNPANLAEVGQLEGITVQADKTVLPKHFYLTGGNDESQGDGLSGC